MIPVVYCSVFLLFCLLIGITIIHHFTDMDRETTFYILLCSTIIGSLPFLWNLYMILLQAVQYIE